MYSIILGVAVGILRLMKSLESSLGFNSISFFILLCGFFGGLEHLIMFRFGDALFDDLLAFASALVFARRLWRFVSG